MKTDHKKRTTPLIAAEAVGKIICVIGSILMLWLIWGDWKIPVTAFFCFVILNTLLMEVVQCLRTDRTREKIEGLENGFVGMPERGVENAIGPGDFKERGRDD